jgi:hypothetical protein
MRRTTDAGIVAADQPLASGCDCGVIPGQKIGQKLSQIVFNLALILRRGGDNRGERHFPLAIDDVSMIQEPARRLGGRASLAGAGLVRNAGRPGGRVRSQNAQRLFEGVDQFQAAGDDPGNLDLREIFDGARRQEPASRL